MSPDSETPICMAPSKLHTVCAVIQYVGRVSAKYSSPLDASEWILPEDSLLILINY
jgi:hypothetical protein